MNNLRLVIVFLIMALNAGCLWGFLGTPKQELHRMGAKIEPLDGCPVRISLRGKRVSVGALAMADCLCSNHSAEYSELRELDLSRSTVTDDGLQFVVMNAGNFAKLRRLDLRETHVSEDAVASLQDALPDCVIVR